MVDYHLKAVASRQRPRKAPSANDGSPPFVDLTFGLAAAEDESARDPRLLIDGFLDAHGVESKILQDHHYLVLGYKGAGKSAVAQHLELLADGDPCLFTETLFLSNFPYAEFRSMVPGDSDSDIRMPLGWTWVLVCQLLSMFDKDESAEDTAANQLVKRTVEALREHGYVATTDIPQFVRQTVKKSLKASLPKILEYSRESTGTATSEFDFSVLLERLVKTCTDFRSDSEHVLIVDGLDDVLIGSQPQLKALAALFLAVARLNAQLASGGAVAKVVVLCRSDLFERIPSTNKNKIRQDSAVTLDWYHHTRTPKESELVSLARKKAEAGGAVLLGDPLEVYFPAKMKGRPIYNFLLDYTRHTPRDFLSLLRHCQRHVARTTRTLSTEQIQNGIAGYSKDYFYHEIRDELVGYIPVDEADFMFELIASCRDRLISLDKLIDESKKREGPPVQKLVEHFAVLFECSAIGNCSPAARQYTFKYRNRQSQFDRNQFVAVHPGLYIALNLAP
jgi:hypothetical protein